jgi:hypothetical protein
MKQKQIAGVKIRLARAEDKEAVLAICQQTWEHSSDSLPLYWDKWLANPRSRIFVAEMDGVPIAIEGVALLSEREAWWQGLRVDPHSRRRGQGLFLIEVLRKHIERYLLEANIKFSRGVTCSNNTFMNEYMMRLHRQKTARYFPYKADAIDSSTSSQVVQLNTDDFDLAWVLVTSCNLFNRELYLYMNCATKWQELTQEQLRHRLNEGKVCGIKQGEQLLGMAIEMPVHTIDFLEGANQALWKNAHQTLWIGYANGTDEGLTKLLYELRQLAHSKGYLAVGGFFPISDRIFEFLDIAGYQQAEELEYWVYEWQTQNLSDINQQSQMQLSQVVSN